MGIKENALGLLLATKASSEWHVTAFGGTKKTGMLLLLLCQQS